MVASLIAYFPRCTATAVDAAISAPGESNKCEKGRDRKVSSEREEDSIKERQLDRDEDRMY